MTQIETLFEETDQRAWRLVIEVKAGGGPFDGAGFALRVVNPRGALVALEVIGAESSQWPMAQMFELIEKAQARLATTLVDHIVDEVHQRG